MFLSHLVLPSTFFIPNLSVLEKIVNRRSVSRPIRLRSFSIFPPRTIEIRKTANANSRRAKGSDPPLLRKSQKGERWSAPGSSVLPTEDLWRLSRERKIEKEPRMDRMGLMRVSLLVLFVLLGSLVYMNQMFSMETLKRFELQKRDEVQFRLVHKYDQEGQDQGHQVQSNERKDNSKTSAADEEELLEVDDLLRYLNNDGTPTESSRVKKREKTGTGIDESWTSGRKPTRVCAVALNKRQGSIFRTNLMAHIGSGNYTYYVRGPGGCPWEQPRVRMIAFVKCCSSKVRVRKSIAVSLESYDIVIVTGDEYCMIDDPRVHFRQYHGDQLMDKGYNPFPAVLPGRFPLFMPLGPRAEFERVPPALVKPASQRAYLFNFMGSLTSNSRRQLKSILLTNEFSQESIKSFVHITGRWKIKISTSNGYVSPDKYRQVLLDSKFTLCPIGHNPEAYRIYESCEAGSIPILTNRNSYYLKHKCKNAYKPFLDANAPFVWLDDWNSLASVMKLAQENSTWVEEKQRQIYRWYDDYMTDFGQQFETVMQWRYEKRMSRNKPKPQELQEEAQQELSEAKEAEQEEKDQETFELEEESINS